MSDNSQPDSKKAINFLGYFRKDGVHNIVAIDPLTEKIIGITRPSGHGDLATFIEKYNGKRNLYFSVNEPSAAAPDTKLKKEHIGKISAIYLDADPNKNLPFEREKKRLAKFAVELKMSENPPTYIIDSGGGIQAFWLYDEPLNATKENIEKAESLGRGLAEKYDTDHVQNIDRIMRVPFTVNIPTKKKAGRKPTLAKIIYAESPEGKRYADMDFVTPSQSAQPKITDCVTVVDMEEIKKPLPNDLLERFKATLDSNKRAHDIYFGLIEKPSRSEYDFTLTQQLKWAGYTVQEIAHILWYFPHGKGNDLTAREIIRCYDRVEDMFPPLDPAYIAEIEAQGNPITLKKELCLKNNISSGLIFAGETNLKNTAKPILKRLIDEESVNMVFGPPNSGKSFLTLSMGMSVAAGQDWGHYKIKQRHGVLIVCAEAGQSYAKRILAAMQHLGFNHTPSPQELPLGYMTDYINLRNDDKSVKLVLDRIKELEDRSGINCGMVIIDTLSASFGGGNENASEDAKQFINNMKKIKHLGKTAPVIVHHTGKDESAGARGHSSFLGDMDTHLRVTAKKYGPRWERKLVPEKVRDADKNHELKFGLNVMEVGHDDDGDVIDTCHVVFETDFLFADVSASPIDSLPQNQKSAYLTLRIYNKMMVSEDFASHGLLKKPEITAKKEIFHILKNHENASEIKDDCRGLDAIKNCYTGDIDDKSLRSSGTMLHDACKELAKKGLTEKSEIYQLVE